MSIHQVPLLFVLCLANAQVHEKGAAVAAGGCCFTFGLGGLNKPCCLTSWTVPNASACQIEFRHGGLTGFTTSACPASVDAAAAMTLEKSQVALAVSFPAVQVAEQSTANATASSVPASALANASAGAAPDGVHDGGAAATSYADSGCCFTFGFGAWDKPCCLASWMVATASACDSALRYGGATGFTASACPTSADDAAVMVLSQLRAALVPQPALAFSKKAGILATMLAEVEWVVAKGLRAVFFGLAGVPQGPATRVAAATCGVAGVGLVTLAAAVLLLAAKDKRQLLFNSAYRVRLLPHLMTEV